MAKNVSEDVPLMPYKDEVLGVFSVGLKASSSRLPTLSGLKGMITTKNLLSDEELGFIVHNVDEIIESGTDSLEESRYCSLLSCFSIQLMRTAMKFLIFWKRLPLSLPITLKSKLCRYYSERYRMLHFLAMP